MVNQSDAAAAVEQGAPGSAAQAAGGGAVKVEAGAGQDLKRVPAAAVDKSMLLRNALKRTFSGSFMDGGSTGAGAARQCRSCAQQDAAPQSAMCDACNRSWAKGAGGALRPGVGAGSMEPAGMMPPPNLAAPGGVHAVHAASHVQSQAQVQVQAPLGSVKGEGSARGQQVTAFDAAAANVVAVVPPAEVVGPESAFGFELNEFFDELFEAGASDGDGESADVEPIDFAVDLERFVVGGWAAGAGTAPGDAAAAGYDVDGPDIVEERPEAFRNSAAGHGTFWMKARTSSGSEVSTASNPGMAGSGIAPGGGAHGMMGPGGVSMEPEGHTPRKKYVYGKEGVAGGQPGGQCLRCHGCVRPNKHPGHCKTRTKDSPGAKREAMEQAGAAAKKKQVTSPVGMAERPAFNGGAVVVGP